MEGCRTRLGWLGIVIWCTRECKHPEVPSFARLPEVGQRLGEGNQFVLHWVETNASQKTFEVGSGFLPVVFARPVPMM
jgi:hypothetical protein